LGRYTNEPRKKENPFTGVKLAPTFSFVKSIFKLTLNTCMPPNY
jgi:hypothetical protein